MVNWKQRKNSWRFIKAQNNPLELPPELPPNMQENYEQTLAGIAGALWAWEPIVNPEKEDPAHF